MGPIIVLYYSKNGHSERIATHIYQQLNRSAEAALLMNLEDSQPTMLTNYAEIILVAPLYVARYPRKFRRFLRERAAELALLSTSFVSVSLTQATLGDPAATPDDIEDAREALATCLEDLFLDTRFKPTRVLQVAGALSYTKYNALIRWITKRIAGQYGASTDTSCDHDLTNWAELDAWTAGRCAEMVVDDEKRGMPSGSSSPTHAQSTPAQ